MSQTLIQRFEKLMNFDSNQQRSDESLTTREQGLSHCIRMRASLMSSVVAQQGNSFPIPIKKWVDFQMSPRARFNAPAHNIIKANSVFGQ